MPASFNAFSLDAGPSGQHGTAMKQGMIRQWEEERRGLFGMERDGVNGWRLSNRRRQRKAAIEAETDPVVKAQMIAEDQKKASRRRRRRAKKHQKSGGAARPGESLRADEEKRLARAMASDGELSSSDYSSSRSWSHCSSCSGSYDDDSWSSFSEANERQPLESSDLSELSDESDSGIDSSEEEALANKLAGDPDFTKEPTDSGSEIIAASDYEPERTTAVPVEPAIQAQPQPPAPAAATSTSAGKKKTGTASKAPVKSIGKKALAQMDPEAAKAAQEAAKVAKRAADAERKRNAAAAKRAEKEKEKAAAAARAAEAAAATAAAAKTSSTTSGPATAPSGVTSSVTAKPTMAPAKPAVSTNHPPAKPPQLSSNKPAIPLKPGPTPVRTGQPVKASMPGVKPPSLPNSAHPGQVQTLQAQPVKSSLAPPGQASSVRPPLLPCSTALPSPNAHANMKMEPKPMTTPSSLANGQLPDPSTIPNPHQPVSVPIPPLNKGPRPPPGPILGTDGQPFIGPEPLKPDLTYATIIYRALANMQKGRGTLGQVCDWVAGEWEWFRMNPDAGWQVSGLPGALVQIHCGVLMSPLLRHRIRYVITFR